MKTEDKLIEAIKKQRAKLKQLQQDKAKAKRRRVAQESKERQQCNQLLGECYAIISGPENLRKLKGYIGQQKTTLLMSLTQGSQGAEATYASLLEYIDALIKQKEETAS